MPDIHTHAAAYLATAQGGVCSFLCIHISFDIGAELCHLPEGTIYFSALFQRENHIAI